MLAVIFEIIVSAAAVSGLGYIIDYFADTSPIFTIIGACIGVLVSILFIKVKSNKSEKNKK